MRPKPEGMSPPNVFRPHNGHSPLVVGGPEFAQFLDSRRATASVGYDDRATASAGYDDRAAASAGQYGQKHSGMTHRNEGLLALTSDGSIDFTCDDFDKPLTVAQRAYLQKKCGVAITQVFWRKQIHGDNILAAHGGAGASKSCPDADAYITDEKNLPIAIRTADCIPVFIFDPRRRVIGLSHAGWKGTYKAIAAKTAQRMQEKYASQPSDLKIVFGQGIRECCYRVGEEFRVYFPSYVKERGGHLYLDLISANRDQLWQSGVRPKNILDSGICTCCNKNYFSFRRDGIKAGRMISLMMLV